MTYLKNYKILIIVIFIASINTIFLIKKPLYNDVETLDLINYIKKNIEVEQLIQTDLSISGIDLGALIRILTNQNIYFDLPFPFSISAFSEWKIRYDNINDLKILFNESNFNLGICKLKKLDINYYIAGKEFNDELIKDFIIYKNKKYTLLRIDKNINCKN